MLDWAHVRLGEGMSLVLIGLGSNQGESVAIVEAAMNRLRAYAAGGSLQQSSLYRTSPVDCAPGTGDFINAAVVFRPRAGLTPETLLADLKALEQEYGRPAVAPRNAPRPLDLDLLAYGDERRDTPRFQLPHPRATARLFVLAPLAEIVPEFEWPGVTCTVQALLQALQTDEHVERLSPAVAAEHA